MLYTHTHIYNPDVCYKCQPLFLLTFTAMYMVTPSVLDLTLHWHQLLLSGVTRAFVPHSTVSVSSSSVSQYLCISSFDDGGGA